MAIDIVIVKKYLAELILSKSYNDEKVNQLDNQVKILRKKLDIDSD